MINKELKEFIQNEIFPVYQKNDRGHNIEHINYVIKRSLKFAKTKPNININMVYTIAAFHDIGCHIDRKNHELVSARILTSSEKLKEFFSKEEIIIMKEAIEDHRASLECEPRSIYGKIVSSADRNTDIENILKRTYSYCLEHDSNKTIDEIIEKSRLHIIDKFGPKGYAKEKIYFEDKDYNNFLKEVELFIKNKELFRKRFIETNNIK